MIGGSVLASAFWAHDLIDELRLYVQPVLLGRGRLRAPPATHIRIVIMTYGGL